MERLFVPRYCSPDSILLIGTTGKLKILYCPFRVKCIYTMDGFLINTFFWVEEVASNESDELTYIIYGKVIKHNSFVIVAGF